MHLKLREQSTPNVKRSSFWCFSVYSHWSMNTWTVTKTEKGGFTGESSKENHCLMSQWLNKDPSFTQRRLQNRRAELSPNFKAFWEWKNKSMKIIKLCNDKEFLQTLLFISQSRCVEVRWMSLIGLQVCSLASALPSSEVTFIQRKRRLLSFVFFDRSRACLNKPLWVMHFTSLSYVSEHYGITHVKVLSLFTKVE